jgi:hypothetical protein
MQLGDLVAAIDSESCAGWSVARVRSAVLGPASTPVRLRVLRPAGPPPAGPPSPESRAATWPKELVEVRLTYNMSKLYIVYERF